MGGGGGNLGMVWTRCFCDYFFQLLKSASCFDFFPSVSTLQNVVPVGAKEFLNGVRNPQKGYHGCAGMAYHMRRQREQKTPYSPQAHTQQCRAFVRLSVFAHRLPAASASASAQQIRRTSQNLRQRRHRIKSRIPRLLPSRALYPTRAYPAFLNLARRIGARAFPHYLRRILQNLLYLHQFIRPGHIMQTASLTSSSIGPSPLD